MKLFMMIMMANDIREKCDLSFPDICLTVEEKPRKKLNHENWPDRIEPEPTGWETTMLSLDHSGGLLYKVTASLV